MTDNGTLGLLLDYGGVLTTPVRASFAFRMRPRAGRSKA